MKIDPLLEPGRVVMGPAKTVPGQSEGMFLIDGPCGQPLKILASGGAEGVVPWEHVSVSLRNRCPNWQEMCWVKDLFWDPEEPVMQLHPPRSKWISNHPFTLHLWRPKEVEIPMPPSMTVGMTAEELIKEDNPMLEAIIREFQKSGLWSRGRFTDFLRTTFSDQDLPDELIEQAWEKYK